VRNAFLLMLIIFSYLHARRLD